MWRTAHTDDPCCRKDSWRYWKQDVHIFRVFYVRTGGTLKVVRFIICERPRVQTGAICLESTHTAATALFQSAARRAGQCNSPSNALRQGCPAGRFDHVSPEYVPKPAACECCAKHSIQLSSLVLCFRIRPLNFMQRGVRRSSSRLLYSKGHWYILES